MKKAILFLFILFVSSGAGLFANKVTVETAQTVAVNFFKLNAPGVSEHTTLTPVLKYTRTEADNTVDYYVFDMQPQTGFVIVAADDIAQPVIGYSTESNFRPDVTKTGLVIWMNHAAERIYKAIQLQVPATARISNLWNAYRQGRNPGIEKSGAVAPLIKTRWDQAPYYNALCPYNSSDNQRCVTGCVATAMAQIMKFWSFPLHGTGSYSYNASGYGTQSADFEGATYLWSQMPLQLTGGNTAVATLMYHCGVSVAMDYGDENQGGSGAAVQVSESWGGQSAEKAFKTYFNYDPHTLRGVYESNYDSSGWLTLLESELDAGRPIQYEGYDRTAGGHSWVCDGYDANNLVHMNWGWSGASDGYFAVSSLTGGGYNFNLSEGALIGIQPLKADLTASAQTNTLCSGESTLLTATGYEGATYSWTPTTGLACSTCAYTFATPTATTTYTVTIDSVGFRNSVDIVITVNPKVTVAVDTVGNATCYGSTDGSAAITASGGTPSYSYHWSSGASSASAIHLTNGEYTVTVTDTKNCKAVTTVTVSSLPQIMVDATTVDATGCTSATGGANVSVTGGSGSGYLYNWNTGSTTDAISDVAAGDYSLTVTDGNSCTTVIDVVVNQPYALSVSTNVTASGNNNGTATVDVSGGSSPYNYSWSSGAVTQTATGLAPGDYTVTVTDAQGCFSTAAATVEQATGINNTQATNSFSLFPNPAKNEITVHFAAYTTGTSIVVEDILGKTLLTMPVTAPETQVDLSALPNGVYLLQLNQVAKRTVRKFVVNK
ncbi:MAG TPA: C10 family peptidase [Chitinophagales bacterium]|nr:C10 family peptidase [Chitinophagales bacterium]